MPVSRNKMTHGLAMSIAMGFTVVQTVAKPHMKSKIKMSLPSIKIKYVKDKK
jgi:hypothetical protein